MRRLGLRSLSLCAPSLGASLFVLAALGLLACTAGRAGAQSDILPGIPQLNPANGHYYQFVRYRNTSDRTFATALAAASASSHNGIPGHLATLTSFEEQRFLEAISTPVVAYWMGASDAAVEGEWRWITGPEAGQLFWRTESVLQNVPVGSAIGFESWSRFSQPPGEYLEPNDTGGRRNGLGEDYATVRFRYRRDCPDGPYYRSSIWNDLFGDDVNSGSSQRLFSWVDGYIVEYSIPEPGSGIMALVGAALLQVRRRCR